MTSVSCVLLTCDRPGFLPQALKYIERQTYRDREVIVVDSGRSSIAKLVPPEMRYVRTPVGTPIGAARNMGCEYADGELVAMFDDDDWYGAERLQKQVDFWMTCGPDPSEPARAFDIVGSSSVVVYEASTRRAGKTGLLMSLFGPTLMFTRAAWAKLGYRHASAGEEIYFCRGRATGDMGSCPDWFVYVRHARNVTGRVFERTLCQEDSAAQAERARVRMGDDVAFYDTIG